LARIQTYSSALKTTAEERRATMADAREAIDRAAEASPDDAFVYAIRSLVYDWSASAEETILGGGRRDEYLTAALAASARALTIAPGDPLATAFKAEVDIDQQNFALALDEAAYAAGLADPGDPYSMDIFRVYGTVLENNGQYSAAIQQYLNASDIAPNFTYLYLLIGANYRRLAGDDPLSTGRQDLINQALDYFDRAARINEQLAIQDPTPYLAIGRTYLQQGEFFIAAINIERALSISPDAPDIYGRLGLVFFRARNYESAVVALQCAVDGCGPEVSVQLLCQYVYNCDPATEEGQAFGVQVTGLQLGDESLEYYYTYGSVLVYFRDTAEYPNACADADRIFQQLLAAYGDDAVVAGIAAESRSLCRGQAPTPEGTVTPEAMLAPTLGPSP
jgi:tetratricopeptide (TPR) repeat protein